MTQTLLDRVRARLWEEPSLREVKMFGGISFMVADLMVVAVRKDESLLVRVDPAESQELQRRPGASIAQMGAGRSMGPSWLTVTADALTDEEELDAWLAAAFRHHAAQLGDG